MYSHYAKAYENKKEKTENKMDQLLEISVDNFVSILKEYKIVVVDVWASWCNPCLAAGEKFLEFLSIFERYIESQDVIFVKDNIDREESVHVGNIEAVPCFFIYHEGVLFKKLTGFNMQDIGDTVENLLLGRFENPVSDSEISPMKTETRFGV